MNQLGMDLFRVSLETLAGALIVLLRRSMTALHTALLAGINATAAEQACLFSCAWRGHNLRKDCGDKPSFPTLLPAGCKLLNQAD